MVWILNFKALQPISLRDVSTSAQNAALNQSTVLDSSLREDWSTATSSSNGRVMLIDGTSIIYRAYYKLIGTLENLLQCVEQVEEERIKKAMLRSDLPFYMVPFTTKDLAFIKPEDNGEKFKSLLHAISAYAEEALKPMTPGQHFSLQIFSGHRVCDAFSVVMGKSEDKKLGQPRFSS